MDKKQPSASLESVLDELTLGPAESGKCAKSEWHWDREAAEKLVRDETLRFEEDNFTVKFHPLFAYGTAAVWGQCLLTESVRAYWEISVIEVYGSSMMFGIGTRDALQAVPYGFVDLLGGVGRLGDQAYGLSHKGSIFHSCEGRPFCERLRTVGGPCTVGVLFDGPSARLGFSLDGQWLGWAFPEVKLAGREYFPMVSSTAQRSEFKLLRHRQRRLRTAPPLQGICMDAVVRQMLRNRGTELPLLGRLGLPRGLECQLWHKWCGAVMNNDSAKIGHQMDAAVATKTEQQRRSPVDYAAGVTTDFAPSPNPNCRKRKWPTDSDQKFPFCPMKRQNFAKKNL